MDATLLMGFGAPQTVAELVWYGFGACAGYFLWSIKKELIGLRQDIKEEANARVAIDLRLTKLETRCGDRVGCING